MNRKMTPILLAVALLAGLVTYLSETSSRPGDSHAVAQAPRVLEVDQADILEVRMKRDYWNSYTLRRGPDGVWALVEPSREPASVAAVSGLLSALERLPVISRIDLPTDDSERHREYGLWKPSMEVTVVTGDGEHTLQFGSKTADGEGVYCAEAGRDGVSVTEAKAVGVISADYTVYRQQSGTAATRPAARPRAEATAGSRIEPAAGAPPASPLVGKLRVEDLARGEGEAVRLGQKVTVHYLGRLENGTTFDDSRKKGKPITFTVGKGELIKSFDRGVVGMRVGGKRRLTIPPEMGYGDRGRAPAIPPNATLIFEVELISIAKQ
jgi:FKBP-type peptidyl-prolyl cis-trans isomerase FkpA